MASSTIALTGLVLAGTYPWRQSRTGCQVPRPLLPIAHRPLLSYAVSWLHDAGLREATICGRRELPALRAAMTSAALPAMRLSYHADVMPRGAAGSLRDAAFATSAERFVVAEGTAIPNLHLPALLEAHCASGADLTVVVQGDDCTSTAGGLQLSSGIYVIERRALELVPPTGFCDMKEALIPALYKAGRRVAAYAVDHANVRVMNWDTYLAVNGWLIDRLACASTPPAGYERRGLALIHATATVARDAVLLGPVMVGPQASIQSRAVIVGPCSIGPQAVVERDALVSRSAIWHRGTVSAHVVADRTIVAENAVVEAHSRHYRAIVPGTIPAAADRVSSLVSRWRNAPDLWRRASRTLLTPPAQAAR